MLSTPKTYKNKVNLNLKASFSLEILTSTYAGYAFSGRLPKI